MAGSRVIHNPELPPGWLGKCNAMQQAAADRDGEMLLFTDGDIIYQPSCVATALRRAGTPRARLSEPVSRGWTASRFGKTSSCRRLSVDWRYLPRRGSRILESSEALAAGAFLLVKAPAFRAIGGFEPIRGEMVDDVALARLLKSKGYRVGFRFAPEFLHVRIYKDNRHAFWGMTKNVLVAIQGRFWLAPAVMVLPLFVFWTPLYCAIAGLIEGDPTPGSRGGGRLHRFLMRRCGPAAGCFHSIRSRPCFTRWSSFLCSAAWRVHFICTSFEAKSPGGAARSGCVRAIAGEGTTP